MIDRVSTLFAGHPALIQGFNTFLPPGYHIECSMDPRDANIITVTTPQGTTTQSMTGSLSKASSSAQPRGSTVYTDSQDFSSGSSLQPGTFLPSGPFQTTLKNQPTNSQVVPGPTQLSSSKFPNVHERSVDFPPTEQALEYVNRIKKRYADDPDSYQHFLELLERFNKSPEEVSHFN